MTSPARAVFAVVVVAAFAAFVITQRLKHTPTVVQQIRETPYIAPGILGHRTERISFKLKQADLVTVTIEDSQGRTVATVASDLPVSRYHTCAVAWNGKTTSGALAQQGSYTARFTLKRQGRSILSSLSFQMRYRVAHPMAVAITNTACAA
jgi:hypothetical protein